MPPGSPVGVRSRGAAFHCSRMASRNTSSGACGRSAGGMIVIRFGSPKRYHPLWKRTFTGQRWQDPGEIGAGRDKGFISARTAWAVADAHFVRRGGRAVCGMFAAMRVSRMLMRGCRGRRDIDRHSDERHQCMRDNCEQSEPRGDMVRSSFHVLSSITNARIP
jgi:hypothetical protein